VIVFNEDFESTQLFTMEILRGLGEVVGAPHRESRALRGRFRALREPNEALAE
jgi:hypothetical protein